jgi:hypothetical protein
MGDIKAIICGSELDFIAKCVLDYPDLETGGDYFGYWNKDGMPVIQYVTGPGKQTTRTGTSFYQDIDYLHKCGDYLHSNYCLEHIGAWHSHHKLSLNHPSGGDVSTMKNALRNVDKFFITICNITGRKDVSINGFLFSNNFPNLYIQNKWVIIPKLSLVRRDIESGKHNFFTCPATKEAIFFVDETELGQSKKVVFEDKIELENLFFETPEGRKFLKSEFDKIKSHPDCKDVEIVQNEDKTIAIAFQYGDKEMEIRYPNDFSDKNPNPVIIEKGVEKEIRHHILHEMKSAKFESFSPYEFLKRFFNLK